MKILRVTAILLLFFLISACGTKKEIPTEKVAVETPSTPVKKEVKLVTKATKAEYMQANPIQWAQIERVIETSVGKSTCQVAQISGLKDKTLEAELNSIIINDVENIIKSYAKDDNSQWFYANVEFSTNNLISVTIGGDYPLYAGGLLYRITDGKRFYLKDLFTEGTDYVSLLNRKIIEEILGGYEEESDILREPFSTIDPEQPFVLNYSDLSIIFQKGEAGFAYNYMVKIPLSEIDGYMDILDRQEIDTDIFEQPQLALKHNNIFINNIREIVNTPNGDLEASYPIITGMRNPDLENKVNSIIKEKYNEFLGSEYVKELKVAEPMERYGNINMYVTFNDYGYLSILQDGYLECKGFDYWENLKVYTIDLRNGNLIDSDDILNNYAGNHPEFKAAFTDKVKSSLRMQYQTENPDKVKKIDEIDYSYIMENGTVYFESSIYSTEPNIIARFKLNLIDSYPEYAFLSLYTDLGISPEALFENR